jgi:hypothetical protein
MISTGIVTLAATILFIVPYVCLLNVDALIRKPWRIYVESGSIAIFVSLVLTYFTKPQAETFLRRLPFYLAFALLTSQASSFFFMRKVKAMTNQQVVTQ